MVWVVAAAAQGGWEQWWSVAWLVDLAVGDVKKVVYRSVVVCREGVVREEGLGEVDQQEEEEEHGDDVVVVVQEEAHGDDGAQEEEGVVWMRVRMRNHHQI